MWNPLWRQGRGHKQDEKDVTFVYCQQWSQSRRGVATAFLPITRIVAKFSKSSRKTWKIWFLKFLWNIEILCSIVTWGGVFRQKNVRCINVWEDFFPARLAISTCITSQKECMLQAVHVQTAIGARMRPCGRILNLDCSKGRRRCSRILISVALCLATTNRICQHERSASYVMRCTQACCARRALLSRRGLTSVEDFRNWTRSRVGNLPGDWQFYLLCYFGTLEEQTKLTQLRRLAQLHKNPWKNDARWSTAEPFAWAHLHF